MWGNSMLGMAIQAGARIFGFRDRRRADRFPSVVNAIVMTSGQTYECTTVDLSSSGTQLVFDEANSIAGFIEFRIPSFRFKTHARVVWCDNGLSLIHI